jgi:hypothetical protein
MLGNPTAGVGNPGTPRAGITRISLNSLNGVSIAFQEMAVSLSARRSLQMAADNWTFWLNMTNFALGIITLLALVIVFGAVGWDLLVRKAQSAREHGNLDLSTLDGELRAMLNGSHSLYEPGLGLTMADGGERIDTAESQASDQKSGK